MVFKLRIASSVSYSKFTSSTSYKKLFGSLGSVKGAAGAFDTVSRLVHDQNFVVVKI